MGTPITADSLIALVAAVMSSEPPSRSINLFEYVVSRPGYAVQAAYCYVHHFSDGRATSQNSLSIHFHNYV
jgi:ketosteroid isomerase-like protein